LPDLLTAVGYPSSAFMGAVAPIFRGLASRVARRLGFGESRFVGKGAGEILAAARTTIRAQRRGLIVLHWPDADHAGHAHGWMSYAYREGCIALDRALGSLAIMTDIANDSATLLIALADHGGGGLVANDHESDHPLDRTIPLLLRGPLVARVELLAPRLVDVPATALWALGLDIPASYEGRVLHEAFTPANEMIIAT
jgi:bisphosphoglycerate-independent phosphoglycerate mutase (AlkP superfamily)